MQEKHLPSTLVALITIKGCLTGKWNLDLVLKISILNMTEYETIWGRHTTFHGFQTSHKH